MAPTPPDVPESNQPVDEPAGEPVMGTSMPREKFLWPPARRAAVPIRSADSADQAPTHLGDGNAPDAHPRTDIAPAAFQEHWWSTIERVWLGRTATTWAERTAEARWFPDGPSDYCPRCGKTVGPHELVELADAEDPHKEPACPNCHRKRVPWSRVTRLAEYEGLLRDAVHEVKFTAWRRLGHDLGRALAAQVRSAARHRGLPTDRFVVIPVPTSFRRRLARGIDHTVVLSRGLAAGLDAPILPSLRREHRPSQLTVRASDRWRNVRGTMALRRPIPADRIALILDDVMTTGSTMAEACRAIREGHKGLGLPLPGHLWPVVLGVVGDPERRPAGGPVSSEGGEDWEDSPANRRSESTG